MISEGRAPVCVAGRGFSVPGGLPAWQGMRDHTDMGSTQDQPERLYVATFVTCEGSMIRIVSTDPHVIIVELTGEEAEQQIQNEGKVRTNGHG